MFTGCARLGPIWLRLQSTGTSSLYHVFWLGRVASRLPHRNQPRTFMRMKTTLATIETLRSPLGVGRVSEAVGDQLRYAPCGSRAHRALKMIAVAALRLGLTAIGERLCDPPRAFRRNENFDMHRHVMAVLLERSGRNQDRRAPVAHEPVAHASVNKEAPCRSSCTPKAARTANASPKR